MQANQRSINFSIFLENPFSNPVNDYIHVTSYSRLKIVVLPCSLRETLENKKALHKYVKASQFHLFDLSANRNYKS